MFIKPDGFFWKVFIFCFGYGLFQDRIRNIRICPKVKDIFSVIFATRISFLNLSILSPFNLRIFIKLGMWNLGCRKFMLVKHGQWSDMRDFTTIGANVKLGLRSLQYIWSIKLQYFLANLEGKVILGNKPCVHIKSINSPWFSLFLYF